MKLEDDIEEAQEKVSKMSVNNLRKGDPKDPALLEIEGKLKKLSEHGQRLQKEKANLRLKFSGLSNKTSMEKQFNKLIANEKEMDVLYERMYGLASMNKL